MSSDSSSFAAIRAQLNRTGEAALSAIPVHGIAKPTMYSGFHHVCYVTTNMQKAIEIFAREYGVQRFLAPPDPIESEFHTPRGRETARKYVAMAYVGEMMIELFEPAGGECQIYAEGLPTTGEFALHLHHLAFRIHDRTQWDEFRATLDTKLHPIAIENATGKSKALYTDERVRLGHYCEYMWLTDEDAAIAAAVPRN